VVDAGTAFDLLAVDIFAEQLLKLRCRLAFQDY
jgi:hypothetical protein